MTYSEKGYKKDKINNLQPWSGSKLDLSLLLSNC